jgi:CotH kinase protein
MLASPGPRTPDPGHCPLMRRLQTLIVALALISVVSAQVAPPADHDAFFGLDKIWDVHIAVPNHGWDAMHPKKVDYQARFPYAEATVRIAGHAAITVGLRFKGNSTFWKMPRAILKKSFKLDFDRHRKDQTFLGLKKLNLNNNYYDQTQLREALSHMAYREGSVPSARTAFARVYLTIEGRAEKGPAKKVESEFLGLYTLVEQVDRGFLERQTGHRGALCKPDGEVLPYLGDVWNEKYEKVYGARTKVGTEAARAIIGLAKVIRDHESRWPAAAADGRKDFQTRLAKVLDVDGFLRYLAVTVLIGNGDNWLFMGSKNYYLAVSDKTALVSMLAWDLNNSIGGMAKFTGWNFEELSIHRPTTLTLATRILEVPAWKQRYLGIVRELIEGPCSAERMTAALRVAQKTVAGAIGEESKRGGLPARPADLSRFFAARERSVLDQLAGRSKGVEFGAGKKGADKRGPKKKGTAGKFDAEAYLAGARKKFKAMVAAGTMTAEEAEARIAALEAKIRAGSKGSGKKRPRNRDATRPKKS